MPFQVRVLLLLDALNNDSSANRPNEVHIRGMDHHAVFVRRIEAY